MDLILVKYLACLGNELNTSSLTSYLFLLIHGPIRTLKLDILILLISILFFIINYIFYNYVKNDFYRFIPNNLINNNNDMKKLEKDLIKDHIKKEIKNKNTDKIIIKKKNYIIIILVIQN